MRGIEFKIPGLCVELLDGLDIGAYDWYLYEDEIIVSEQNYSIGPAVSGSQVKEVLFHPNTLNIFMNLQAFPKGAAAEKVRDYPAFQHSQCAFVILVTDMRFVEIYAKSEKDNLLFHRNAKNCNGTELTVKTEENDGRTIFSVI